MTSPSTGLQLDGREMPPEPDVNVEKSEETEEIRRQMHRAINKRDLDRVRKCLDEANYLRQWLNPEDGESALCSAVRQNAFKICGLLRYYNCIPSEEKKKKESEIFRNVRNIENLEYRYQLFRFARESPCSSYLVPRSDSIGSCGETKLPELYQKLNEIPYVKTILQVVATSPHIQIMFDFNNEDLERTLWYRNNSGTWGETFFEEHEIHIGAKRKEDELLGTLAHELCHYALELVYENGAKPYMKDDENTEADYVGILKEIQKHQESLHDVIKRAFTEYRVGEELIVRVPHLLAMHSEQVLQDQVPKLLQFFKDNVIPDMNQFLKNSFGQKDREAIKEQNTRLGKAKGMEKLGITFKTKYDLPRKALLVLTAPNMTFLEVMVNDAVRSTGKSYVFLDTIKWNSELKDVLMKNKCHYVILSSDPKFDLDERNRRQMLDILVELSRVRETKVILLTRDRDQDDFVKDVKQQYIVHNVEDVHVGNANFDNVTDECKETVLRSSRIHFQQKRNVNVSKADVKIFCQALDEDTFLQLCRKKETQVKHEQPSQYDNDASFYVERTCSRVIQVDLERALSDESNEAFAVVGCNREKVPDLDLSDCDVSHYNGVDRFVKCVLLGSVDEYDELKESSFYNDKTIHLIEYKGENTVKKREGKNRRKRGSVHAKSTRAARPCSGKGGSTGYHWMRSNGPVSHLPMVDSGTRQIVNEESLRGIIDEKFVAILGAPGMGKSLLSSRLAQDMKNDEMNWVLHVDLMEKRKFLNLSASLDDSHHAIEQFAKLCDVKVGTFEFSLVEHSIQNAKPFKVAAIFDGFDEVDDKCRQFVTKLANELRATQISKLFLFSRSMCKSEIEDTFHTVAFELIGFDEQQQLGFLRKYWKRNNREMDDAKLDSFAQRTLSRFRASGKYSITENPLLIKMIAEIEEEKLNQLEHGEPDDKTAAIGAKCSFLDVYEKFVENKFSAYLKKQFCCVEPTEHSIAVQHDVKVLKHHFYESYGLLALKVILHRDLIIQLLEKSTLHKLEKGGGLMKEVQEGRLKHGFLDEYSGETPVFLHKTFAEFFAAHFLAHKVSSADGTDEVVYDVVAHMYGSEEYSWVLDFFDAMGTKSHTLHRYIMDNDSESAKNAIKDLGKLDGFERMPLHIAALHADEETLNIISSELNDRMAEELQVKDKLGMTPLMYVDRLRAWKRLDVLCTRCTDQNMKWIKQLRAVNEIITKERRFDQSVFSEAVIMESTELLHYFIEAGGTRKNIGEYFASVFQDRGHGKCSDRKALANINVNEMPRHVSDVLSPCSDIRAVRKGGLTLFHMSAALGLVDICTYLLCRLPVNERNNNGESPLHVGVIYGQPNVVHILLPHSTSKVVMDKNESGPLQAISKFHGLFELRTLYLRAVVHTPDRRLWISSHETALEGHDVVLSLILPHVDGTIRNCGGETSLHLSAYSLFWKSIVLLLPYSDVDSVTHNRETPMLRSVSDNSLLRNLRTTSLLEERVDGSTGTKSQSTASVKLLILHSDVNVADKEGYTALRRSALHKHMDVFRLLLPLSLGNSEGEGGGTLMRYIAKSGNIAAAKVLLHFGFVFAQNHKRMSALHIGAKSGDMDIVRLFLPLTRCELPNARGRTSLSDWMKSQISLMLTPSPLHSCVREGHAEVAEFVLPHSRASQSDEESTTPLHDSISSNDHVDVVRAVLPHSNALAWYEGGDTALHLSASIHCSDVVKALLPYSEVDGTNNAGETPLQKWTESQDVILCGFRLLSVTRTLEDTEKITKWTIRPLKLLILHSDLTIADKKGRTSLHQSVSAGEEFVTKLLLPLSSVSTVDKSGDSSLHSAAQSGHVGALKFLVPLSSVNARDVNGKTALHVSASRGRTDITCLLLLLTSAECRDKKGYTPLHFCTSKGHTNVVEHLLPHSLTTISNIHGRSPLHHGAYFGHLEAARVILPHSKALLRDNNGSTVLHTGAYFRSYTVVRLLLPYSEADTKNNFGSTVLVHGLNGSLFNSQGESDAKRIKMLATGEIEMIKLLLLHSHVNTPGNDGRTALHVGNSIGQLDVIKLLLPFSSVNIVDKSGNSSLHSAAQSGHVGALKFLVPLSSVNARDVNGMTALHVSVYHSNIDTTTALLPLVSIGLRDEADRTPLHMCAREGHTHIAHLLIPQSSATKTAIDGCNQLHLSAAFDHVDTVRLLLPHTDALVRYYDGDAACTVNSGGTRVRCSVGVKLLLPYSDLEMTNNSGRTALMMCLLECIKMWKKQQESTADSSEKSLMPETDDIRMIKILLLHSAADITTKDDGTTLQLSGCRMTSHSGHALVPSNREDGSGEAFVHYAVLRGKVDVARFLLPDSHLRTHGHDGELHKELRTFFDAVDTLRSAGRLTSTSDACKYILLHYCVTKGNARMAELVLPHSSTSGNNRSGCTALQLSSYNGREQIVRVILPHSDVTFRNSDGERALHMGAYRHCYDVVTLLLPYSDINVADKFGNAVVVRSLRGYSLWFDWKAESNIETWEKNKMMGEEDMRVLSMRMMKLLVIHSDLDIVDEDDRTALQVSVSLGLLDVTKLLLPHFHSPFPRLQPCGDEVAKLLCRWQGMH